MKQFSTILAILLVLISFQSVFVHSIDEDNIVLIRSESLENSHIYMDIEPLIFKVEIENANSIDAKIVCKNDDDIMYPLEKTNWFNKTYIFYSKLDNVICDRFFIDVTFKRNDETLSIKKEIKIENFNTYISDILNNQRSDGGFKDPVNTAFGVLAMSQFEGLYEYQIESAIEWLKDNRNDEYKCWPENSCDIKITAKILSILTRAGFDEEQRIVHDAKYYLEQNQKRVVDEIWELFIESDSINNCVYIYDGVLSNFSLGVNDNETFEIIPKANGLIDVTCTDDADFELYKQEDNETIIERDNSEEFSYEIESGCWAPHKYYQYCEIETTNYAIMCNLNSNAESLAKVWLDEKIDTDNINGKFFEDEVLSTALYLYKYNTDKDVRKWLQFRQNNDGSWGFESDSQKIFTTSMAISALTESKLNPYSENIIDGRDYLISHDSKDLSNIEKKASVLASTKNNIRSMIIAKPSIINVESSSAKIELYNPTNHNHENLTIVFSPDIENFVEYDMVEDLLPDSHTYVTFSKKNLTDKSVHYGFFSIYENKSELISYPIIVSSKPILSITSPKELSVFGQRAQVQINANKIDDSFNCKIDWGEKDFSAINNFNLDENKKSVTIDMNFDEAITTQTTQTGVVNCTSKETSYIHNINIALKRFISIPFNYTLDETIIQSFSDDYVIEIKNNFDDAINIFVESYFFEDNLKKDTQVIIIDGKDKEKIDLFNVIKKPNMTLNMSRFDTLTIKSNGYEVEVPFNMKIEYSKPGFFKAIFLFLWAVIKWIFTVGLFLLSLLVGYIILLRVFIMYKVNQMKGKKDGRILDIELDLHKKKKKEDNKNNDNKVEDDKTVDVDTKEKSTEDKKNDENKSEEEKKDEENKSDVDKTKEESLEDKKEESSEPKAEEEKDKEEPEKKAEGDNKDTPVEEVKKEEGDSKFQDVLTSIGENTKLTDEQKATLEEKKNEILERAKARKISKGEAVTEEKDDSTDNRPSEESKKEEGSNEVKIDETVTKDAVEEKTETESKTIETPAQEPKKEETPQSADEGLSEKELMRKKILERARARKSKPADIPAENSSTTTASNTSTYTTPEQPKDEDKTETNTTTKTDSKPPEEPKKEETGNSEDAAAKKAADIKKKILERMARKGQSF